MKSTQSKLSELWYELVSKDLAITDHTATWFDMNIHSAGDWKLFYLWRSTLTRIRQFSWQISWRGCVRHTVSYGRCVKAAMNTPSQSPKWSSLNSSSIRQRQNKRFTMNIFSPIKNNEQWADVTSFKLIVTVQWRSNYCAHTIVADRVRGSDLHWYFENGCSEIICSIVVNWDMRVSIEIYAIAFNWDILFNWEILDCFQLGNTV